MDALLDQIGKRIYERRKQLRLTQDDLSELADVTPQRNEGKSLCDRKICSVSARPWASVQIICSQVM